MNFLAKTQIALFLYRPFLVDSATYIMLYFPLININENVSLIHF